ncbi:hypothetical protein ERS044109_01038, partial [Streptococcus pneumoniae]
MKLLRKNWVLSLGNCHSKNKELEQYLSITKTKKGAKIIGSIIFVVGKFPMDIMEPI